MRLRATCLRNWCWCRLERVMHFVSDTCILSTMIHAMLRVDYLSASAQWYLMWRSCKCQGVAWCRVAMVILIRGDLAYWSVASWLLSIADWIVTIGVSRISCHDLPSLKSFDFIFESTCVFSPSKSIKVRSSWWMFIPILCFSLIWTFDVFCRRSWPFLVGWWCLDQLLVLGLAARILLLLSNFVQILVHV